jgi:amino acid permease
MSCGYCSIAIVMSSLHAAKHGPATQWRHEGISQADRVFSVFNALGSVAFTFGGQAVLPEIQATLARPSREQSTAPTMMKVRGWCGIVDAS